MTQIEEIFRCSGCGDKLPRRNFHEAHYLDRGRQVTSRCRLCRREDYYTKAYPNSICMQCLKHRPLDTNDICKGCNAANGVRQCHGVCNDILPILLGFERSRTICKLCRATRAESERQARERARQAEQAQVDAARDPASQPPAGLDQTSRPLSATEL